MKVFGKIMNIACYRLRSKPGGIDLLMGADSSGHHSHNEPLATVRLLQDIKA